jgi:phospholipid/cholesterol/gamma-HCH transport system ATP-binding protein
MSLPKDAQSNQAKDQAEETPMLEVRNLVKCFGNRAVLDGINFSVKKGETLVIMGGSGCGKSTMLKHLIGFYMPNEGEVLYKGRNLADLNRDETEDYRKKFGILFQSGALFNSMNVGENVALPLREHSTLAEKTIRIIVKMKLEQVGLRGFEDLMPSQISGGMKKRVGLARAIALDPELVFYDEPSAGLDPIVVAVVDQLMKDLSKKLGITSIVVTHDMTSAFRIADQMVVLYMGKVIAVGSPDEIRNSSDERVLQFINGSPDGPIPMRQSKGDYLRDLFDIDPGKGW